MAPPSNPLAVVLGVLWTLMIAVLGWIALDLESLDQRIRELERAQAVAEVLRPWAGR